MAAPNHKAARKIDFCGPVHSGILPKKRGVQVVISSSGRHAVAQLAGTTFLAKPVSVVKLAQPVAVSTSVLSPKEPPPDTILLSPQRNATPEIAPGSEERIMANTMNFEPLECGEGMDECAAAMVLMNLSCSPRSPNCWTTNPVFHREASSSWSDRLSPTSTASSSGVASYPDATPSPPLTASIHHTHHQDASHQQNLQYNHHGGGLHSVDEGIHLMDDSEYEASPKEGTRTAYKCTWKGCDFITLTCSVVERHVRDAHLGPRDEDSDEDSDSEVEFYYTEIDVTPNDFPGLFDDAIDQDTDARDSDTSSQHGWQRQSAPPSHYDTHDYHRPYQQQTPHQRVVVVGSVQEQHLSCNVGTTTGGFMASSAPTMSHMDMARPPHENPELRQQGYQSPVTVGDTSLRSNAVPISIPQRGGSCHPYGGSPLSPHKYPRFSPKSCSSPKISVLRPSRRADSKKCRKVYGVDNRDMWCTQCKWKKACSRFND